MFKYKGSGAVTAEQWDYAKDEGRIAKTISRISPTDAPASIASIPSNVIATLRAEDVAALVAKAVEADGNASRAVLGSVSDRIDALAAVTNQSATRVDTIAHDVAALRAYAASGAEAVTQMRARIGDLNRIADLASAARVAAIADRDVARACSEADRIALRQAVDEARAARAALARSEEIISRRNADIVALEARFSTLEHEWSTRAAAARGTTRSISQVLIAAEATARRCIADDEVVARTKIGVIMRERTEAIRGSSGYCVSM